MSHQQKIDENFIRQELEANIVVGTIPEGIECYLWNELTDSISHCHFPSTGPIRVLLLRGHGPLHNFLENLYAPGKKRNSLDLDELKSMASKIPIIGNWMRKNGPRDDIIEIIKDEFGNEADAMLMAASPDDGKLALEFLYDGGRMSYTDLLDGGEEPFEFIEQAIPRSRERSPQGSPRSPLAPYQF